MKKSQLRNIIRESIKGLMNEQGYGQSEYCNPSAWSNHANWTSTFTNTVANLNPNNPNQPCNFLNKKTNQFWGNWAGGQGGYSNMLFCKLELAGELHSQNNCACEPWNSWC